MLKGVRIGLVIAGCVFLVLFGWVSRGIRAEGTPGETRWVRAAWFEIGRPWPWYEERASNWGEANDSDGFFAGLNGPVLSPTWAFPPLALALFAVARRLKPPPRSEAVCDVD